MRQNILVIILLFTCEDFCRYILYIHLKFWNQKLKRSFWNNILTTNKLWRVKHSSMGNMAKDSLSSTLCVVTTAITHNCRRDSNTLTPLMLCNLCVLLWTLCYKVAAIGIWSWFQWPQSFDFGWQQNIYSFLTWFFFLCLYDNSSHPRGFMMLSITFICGRKFLNIS